MGIASTLLGAVFGGIIGVISGYFGGWFDLMTQRMMDILQGLPLLILALVMAAALGPSIGNVIVAISVPIIPRAQRVIRGSVIAIREFAYIEAARALGVGHSRIAFRHVLPNTMGPFIVLMTAQFGGAILVEAALSFLGLGVPEPYPSWGRMLSVSAAEFAQKAPWLVLFPGIAISLSGFRLESSRRCRPRQTRPATTRSVKAKQPNRKGLSKKVAGAYCDRRCPAVMTHASILKQERKKATR